MDDTDRLIKFMREEAENAVDERQTWFAATGDALEQKEALLGKCWDIINDSFEDTYVRIQRIAEVLRERP